MLYHAVLSAVACQLPWQSFLIVNYDDKQFLASTFSTGKSSPHCPSVPASRSSWTVKWTFFCSTMVNAGLNPLFNVVLWLWTREHIFVVVWLENRICVGTNSVSRCLLMASMTRFVVHFRLSTTYQEQNMSMWWACTFHLIIFSHTHSSQQLFTLRKISYGRKRLQCSMPQMIFTATNQQ